MVCVTQHDPPILFHSDDDDPRVDVNFCHVSCSDDHIIPLAKRPAIYISALFAEFVVLIPITKYPLPKMLAIKIHGCT